MRNILRHRKTGKSREITQTYKALATVRYKTVIWKGFLVATLIRVGRPLILPVCRDAPGTNEVHLYWRHSPTHFVFTCHSCLLAPLPDFREQCRSLDFPQHCSIQRPAVAAITGQNNLLSNNQTRTVSALFPNREDLLWRCYRVPAQVLPQSSAILRSLGENYCSRDCRVSTDIRWPQWQRTDQKEFVTAVRNKLDFVTGRI